MGSPRESAIFWNRKQDRGEAGVKWTERGTVRLSSALPRPQKLIPAPPASNFLEGKGYCIRINKSQISVAISEKWVHSLKYQKINYSEMTTPFN